MPNNHKECCGLELLPGDREVLIESLSRVVSQAPSMVSTQKLLDHLQGKRTWLDEIYEVAEIHHLEVEIQEDGSVSVWKKGYNVVLNDNAPGGFAVPRIVRQ